MKYGGSLFAVKDINRARKFYEELFGLVVMNDFGRNIFFKCGLGLQEDFDWLVEIAKGEMKTKENNCELCFETEDFDGFISKLRNRNDITYLHDIKEHSWGQRVIRFYDLDEHLIEVGESMNLVTNRFLDKGLSFEEIAEIMDVKVDDVKRMLE